MVCYALKIIKLFQYKAVDKDPAIENNDELRSFLKYVKDMEAINS
jgi:hypothetical protein